MLVMIDNSPQHILNNLSSVEPVLDVQMARAEHRS